MNNNTHNICLSNTTDECIVILQIQIIFDNTYGIVEIW